MIVVNLPYSILLMKDARVADGDFITITSNEHCIVKNRFNMLMV